jgi:hypothetical protein
MMGGSRILLWHKKKSVRYDNIAHLKEKRARAARRICLGKSKSKRRVTRAVQDDVYVANDVSLKSSVVKSRVHNTNRQ